jgi:hypothetical protein
MLAAEVPLHYLFNFSSTGFTAVEQGIADARACCAARGIPLTAPAQRRGLLALTFHEVMQGPFPVCTENLIRVDDVMESPKLAE